MQHFERNWINRRASATAELCLWVSGRIELDEASVQADIDLLDDLVEAAEEKLAAALAQNPT